MSHSVVRGKPTASQLYMDGVLNEILVDRGNKPNADHRRTVTLGELLFHCMKRRPKDTFMINGATGEFITNEQLLKRAISLARALIADEGRGKRAMLLMRNHIQMGVVYFAMLFSGIEFFAIDPNTTSYELTYFLNLIEPAYVFHDDEHDEVLRESLKNSHIETTAVATDHQLMAFVGYCDNNDISTYRVPTASPDDTVMFLPTSGSTGQPKAAALTHAGLIIQISTIWTYHTKFPTPTSLAMVLSTMQWVTFTMAVTTCVAYHVPLLVSNKNTTVEIVTHLLEKYKPTWTFLGPSFASTLALVIRPDQLASLETLILLGAKPTSDLVNVLKMKLPKTAHLCDGYGCTEAQGFIALPNKDTSVRDNGWVNNSLYYKVVDENGKELGPKQAGELWVKGASIIKKYHKYDASNCEWFTPDGWFRTGDKFYLNESERVSFICRIKFRFEFRGYEVAPEEVESVIFSIPGVRESIVCATDNGPAAAIVKLPNAEIPVEKIHETINERLSNHKRLHGGIIFVPSLPRTHTGKLDRNKAKLLILEALNY